MKEKPNFQPEAQGPSREAGIVHERHHPQAETSSIEQANEHTKHEQLDAIRKEIGKEAHAADEIRQSKSESERNIPPNPPAKRELQRLMRDRTLNRIRKQLPAPERLFSKVIHNKPVEAISSAGEKTIARPYGILGGGICALIGSSLTFYLAKTYGFRYNLFLFFIFFVAGYVLATALEVLVKLVRAKR